MDNGEPFKPEINLQEFSVIAEGIKYWESPIIREKIRRCAKYDDFYYILLEVVGKLKETCLPLSIYIKIQNAIIFIGIEMFHWIKYLKSDLNLGLQFTDKMYFTNFGTIDEVKTFQLYWQNDPNLLCEYSNDLPSLYSIACINCQEQFVSDNWNRMREILQNYCGSFLNIPEDVSAYSLMSIWICCYVKKTKRLGCGFYKLVIQNEHPEAILFSICSVNGFLNGVKYFGNRLKRERDRLFYHSAELTLKELLNKNGRSSPDNRDNFIDIIIFLIKEMTPETRSLYFRKNFKNLFDTFIYVWPHNKSFLFQLLYCYLPDMQEADQIYLLERVLKWKNREMGNWATGLWTPWRVTSDFIYGITREILGIILKQIPVDLKNQMVINKAGDFFKDLIYQPDFETIEIIFKDPYIKTHRHEIVTKKIVEALYPDYVKGINFHFLQKFTEECLTGDEKDEFKSKFNYAHNFKEILTEGDLDVCKNLISWKAQSEEEIKNLKRGINAKDVFFNAVSKKHVLPFLSIAKELLNWQFDDDEEQIRIFKERMRSEMNDDFIRTKFYDVWNGHLFRYRRPGPYVTVYICSQFFFFIFDKDEAKIFLREKIFGHKSFIKRLTRAKLKNLNDLLRFCDLTAAEILQIKREILNKVDIYISYFAIKETQFFMADDLVNWLVSDEDEKKDVIGDFLNSENGVNLCCNLLGANGNWYNRLDPAWTFLNSWVKPHGNTSELLSALTDRLETAKLSKMKEMFRKLKENECFTKSDLLRLL